MTVVAMYNRNLAEFERHKTLSRGGYFISPEEISRRPGASVGGIVQGIPGVIARFTPDGFEVRMRRAATEVQRGLEECTPTVYIDGRRSMLGMQYVETMFRSEEIAALEVYPRVSQRPMEFSEMFDTCGAIAIWTKPFQARRQGRE